jgi:hypothetical protein
MPASVPLVLIAAEKEERGIPGHVRRELGHGLGRRFPVDGDLVPPQAWRLLASVEGLTGILMCGWSTGFFFAIVSQMHMDSRR